MDLKEEIKKYLNNAVEYHKYQTCETRPLFIYNQWVPAQEIKILKSLLYKIKKIYPDASISVYNWGVDLFCRLYHPDVTINLQKMSKWPADVRGALKDNIVLEMFMLKKVIKDDTAEEREKEYIEKTTENSQRLHHLLPYSRVCSDPRLKHFINRIEEANFSGNLEKMKAIREDFMKEYYDES